MEDGDSIHPTGRTRKQAIRHSIDRNLALISLTEEVKTTILHCTPNE